MKETLTLNSFFGQKNYAYNYDVNEYDEYGNPNIHSKYEERNGYEVKGEFRTTSVESRRYPIVCTVILLLLIIVLFSSFIPP